MHSDDENMMMSANFSKAMLTESFDGVNVFIDMDGTIADLYNVKNWLQYINTELSTYSFANAKMLMPRSYINALINKGANVYVLSMTPRKCSAKYGMKVAITKKHWIEENYPMLGDHIIIIKSMDNKNLGDDTNIVLTTCESLPVVKNDSIIIDDCEVFRQTFKGKAYDQFFNKKQ